MAWLGPDGGTCFDWLRLKVGRTRGEGKLNIYRMGKDNMDERKAGNMRLLPHARLKLASLRSTVY